jgi:predicted chitinase
MKKEYLIIGGVLVLLYYFTRKTGTSEPIHETPITPKPPKGKRGVKNMTNLLYIDKVLREGWGITSRAARIGILCTIGKESNFEPKFEKGYSTTDNVRIREIFPTKCGKLTDERLNYLKANDERWFNFIYATTVGNRPGTGDGYKYRGSGLHQLTGRGNYEKYGKLVGLDLLSFPALNNDIKVATQTTIHFMNQGSGSAKGKAKLKAAGYSWVNSIDNINWAIRFFCSINSGNGPMTGKRTNKAYNSAIRYKDAVSNAILV